MDGVIVLNEFVEKGEFVSFWGEFGFFLLLAGIVVVMLSIIFSFAYSENAFLLIAFIGINLAFLGIIITVCTPREDVTRYQVVIEDNVNFKEFTERYEVISQEGLIYTIEEKTDWTED